MAIDNYPQGQTVRIDFSFRDAADELQDPNTIRLIIDGPEAPAATYVYGAPGSLVLRDDQGIYHALVTCADAGDWVATVTSDDSNPSLVKVKTIKWAVTERPVSV